MINNKSPSFLLLRQHNETLYAVAGGHAYTEIRNAAEDDFGLRLAQRMIEESQIATIKQRSLKGTVRQIMRAVANGDGAPELAVLGEHSHYERSDKLEIRSLTGALVQELWFGTRARVLQQRLIPDISGNGHPEVAVLRTEERSPTDVIIRDIHSRQRIGIIRGEDHYRVERWLAVDDLNGNGFAELVLFARREGVGNQKVRVVDTRTRQILQTFYIDRNALAQDLAACPDINGNGVQEVAMLGRTRDGQIMVIVHDAATGQRLTVVKF